MQNDGRTNVPAAASAPARIWTAISYGMPGSQNQIAVVDPATQSVVHLMNVPFGGPAPVSHYGMHHVFVPLLDQTLGTVHAIDDFNAQTYGAHRIALPAAENIDVLALGPRGEYLYASGAQTYRIDAATDTILRTGAVHLVSNGSPHAVAFSPDGRTIYNATAAGVQVVQAATLSPQTVFAAGPNPQAVVSSEFGRYLYVLGYQNGSTSSVTVLDAATGQTLRSATLAGFPMDITVDTQLHRIYVSTTAAVVDVLDPATLSVAGSVATGNNPNGLDVDPVTHDVWLTDGTGLRRIYHQNNATVVYSTPPLNDAVAAVITQ